MFAILSFTLNISIISFSSSLKKYLAKRFKRSSKRNTHKHYAGPGFRFCWEKLCSSDNHDTMPSLIKVPPLKGSMGLLLEVQNTFFTDSFTLIIWIINNKGMNIQAQKLAKRLIMPPFLHLLTNNRCLRDLLNKLCILSTFTYLSLPFHEVHLVECQP